MRLISYSRATSIGRIVDGPVRSLEEAQVGLAMVSEHGVSIARVAVARVSVAWVSVDRMSIAWVSTAALLTTFNEIRHPSLEAAVVGVVVVALRLLSVAGGRRSTVRLHEVILVVRPRNAHPR